MGCLKLKYQDKSFYPFGSEMESRSFSSITYKYGFNGKEKVDETYGAGNTYDFGARIYDGRLGRWMSVDPMNQYPSGYIGIGNNPIYFRDPDGNWVVGTDGNPVTVKLKSDGIVEISSNASLDTRQLFTAMLTESHEGFQAVMGMINTSTQISIIVSSDVGLLNLGNGTYARLMGATVPGGGLITQTGSKKYGNTPGMLVPATSQMVFFTGTWQFNQGLIPWLNQQNTTIIDLSGVMNTTPNVGVPFLPLVIAPASTAPRDQYTSNTQALHLTGVHEREHLRGHNVFLQNRRRTGQGRRAARRARRLEAKIEAEPNRKEDLARRRQRKVGDSPVKTPRYL